MIGQPFPQIAGTLGRFTKGFGKGPLGSVDHQYAHRSSAPVPEGISLTRLQLGAEGELWGRRKRCSLRCS